MSVIVGQVPFCERGRMQRDEEAAETGKRRLITLIFAGRNRRVVIRRELPRTRSADGAVARRMGAPRILRSVCLGRPPQGAATSSGLRGRDRRA